MGDTAISRIPLDNNFLLPLQSEFQIKRLPGVTFFCQSCVIPGLSIGQPTQDNPFVPIKKAGDTVQFEEFEVEFKVDENLVNWSAIFQWMVELGFPKDHSQYASLEAAPKWADAGPQSDCSIFLLNSRGKPNSEFLFRDAFPVSLSGMTVDTRSENTNFVTCQARFAYTSYAVSSVT